MVKNEKDNLEDKGVDWRIIFKPVLYKLERMGIN
jgi:hypothetical protein